jgi:hypothetical protein
MANRDQVTGFSPVQKLDGSVIPERWFPVAAANATAIFVGDAVSVINTGTVSPSAVDAGAIVIGVVTGIADTNEIPAGHPNSDISTKYLPATTAGRVSVALAMPDCVFAVQADTGTAVAETDRFATANHVAGSGNTTVASSGHELDSSDIGTGAQLKIIDKVDDPDN